MSADSVSATPTTTTENTTMITITKRRRSPRMGSCRPTPTSTAECLVSTQQRGTELVTATSVNVNMDLASRTHRWSLWFMFPQESRFDLFHHSYSLNLINLLLNDANIYIDQLVVSFWKWVSCDQSSWTPLFLESDRSSVSHCENVWKCVPLSGKICGKSTRCVS